jgi:hypothetical protein
MCLGVEKLRLRELLPALASAPQTGAHGESNEALHAAFPMQQWSHLSTGDDGKASVYPFWGSFK